MSTITRRTLRAMARLDEASQNTVLILAERLAGEMDGDVTAFDAAVAEDDGYRISHEELKKKYGI